MQDKSISHEGTPRRSGRYPWGSGKNPYQRNKSFLNYVNDLSRKGLTDAEIAKGIGMKTLELRRKKSLARMEIRKADTALALKLQNQGMNPTEIGRQMGIRESSVRSLLDPARKVRNEVTKVTANVLKDAVDNRGPIDVGVGSELYLGVSRTKLNTAISLLEEEGYKVHYIQVDQLGTAGGKKTNIKVLAPPDMEYKELASNKESIKMIVDHHSNDGGASYTVLEPPKSISSKRVKVRYSEDGGTEKDGTIELRRGVEDISLGGSRYAQVRIAVDNSHYLKGMAMYSDDLPDGVDIVFNTNKHKGTPMLGSKDNSVLKPLKSDPDNPFGAVIKANGQRHYTDKNGKDQLSCINKVNEEGDWDKWSKSLSSQMLSKQHVSLAKKQLGLAYDIKKAEYDEICSLTNPAVKKQLLESFADDCDSSSVHLKAAGMPRQSSYVILPVNSLKSNEVYAPNYRNGEPVVLIRYPHGGTFEIPSLVVNNKNANAKKILGTSPKDAIGINSKVAERLSGADFDGDTVLVIPNKGGKTIKTSPALKGLESFDPKEAYPAYKGMPKMDSYTKGVEMGKVSNLITDMTIKGANTDEICRAVKHSMVVIDAEKHNLNYKKSYEDNNIAQLKKKYQGGANSGSSTVISKSSSESRPYDRKEKKPDPKTGKKIYEYTGESYINKDNKKVFKTVKSSKMAEVDDAFELSSGTPMESVYATHANKLKALGNAARKENLATGKVEYSPSAKKVYEKEVAKLKADLNIALKNAPLERQAQLLANANVKAKKDANPELAKDKDQVKKLKGQELTLARARYGASKSNRNIQISDKQWEAIQAGAISNNTLTKILKNTDLDVIKQRAMPKTTKGLTPAKETQAKTMLSKGYTTSEVADALGVSVSIISKLN